MPTDFYSGTDWEQSSGPYVIVQCHEADIWPIADNSVSGAKDAIGVGLHPVIAIGGRTAADGRPLNVTGVVVSFTAGLTTATGLVRVNIADGFCVRQYVSNILTYAAGAPATFETAPVIGQPVYVDDTDDLTAGVTLSLSPLNVDGLKNPQAGVLWYEQDEYVDSAMGGSVTAAVWPPTWANEATETQVTVMLLNGWRELA